MHRDAASVANMDRREMGLDFKQNDLPVLSRKSGTTRKSMTPRDAKIMLLDFGHLNYPENQDLTTQRSPKVVL